MNRLNFPTIAGTALLTTAHLALAEELYLPPPDESAADDIEIVAGEDRTIFEYRVNGVITMIKIVPKSGRPYYMVPADGAAHFRSLDHSKKLYPSWIVLEW